MITTGPGANVTPGSQPCTNTLPAGVHSPYIAACWGNGVSQSAQGAYYLYVVQGTEYLLTTKPPSTGTSNTVATNCGLSQPCNAYSAVFLTSFVTDQSGNIILFERNGNDVFLEPGGQDVSKMWYTPDLTYGGLTIPPSSPASPSPVLTAAFPQVPQSATAMIVDFEVLPVSSPASGLYSVFFLSPAITSVTAGCKSVALHDYIYVPSPPQGYFLHQLRVPLNTKGQIMIGSCAAATAMNLGVTLVGYVENVNTPGVQYQPPQ